MSIEDQQATIGKLALERSDKNRQRALLLHGIKLDADRLAKLAGDLSDVGNLETLDRAVNAIEALNGDGGLDRVKRRAEDYRSVLRRLGDINQTLNDIGIGG